MIASILELQKQSYFRLKIHRFLPHIFTYFGEMENAVSGCKTLLDVGCGTDSPLQAFSDKIDCYGVDAHLPSIKESRKKKIHKKYYNVKALGLLKHFKPKSFDCVLACEIIEHMSKKDGLKFIKILENLARTKVVIMTPNGFVPQTGYDNNPWQIHKSGWSYYEMKKRGYKVKGLRGLKSLRGEMSELKHRPKIFFSLVSTVTQLFVRNNPRNAFQILCVKEV